MAKKDLRFLDIPQVRSLDGDVFMYLSSDLNDHFVLDSSLLRGSGYFDRVFSNQLSTVDKHAKTAAFELEHPQTKKNVTIFMYSLKYIGDASDSGEEEAIDAAIAAASWPSKEYDETQRRKVEFLSHRMFLLEPGRNSRTDCGRADMSPFAGGRVYKPGERSDYGVGPDHGSTSCNGMDCLREIPPMHTSSLATGFALFVPRSSHSSKSSEEPQYIAYVHAIIAHKVLFALLAGHLLRVDHIDEECMVRCLADVLALAEIYDLLPRIAPKVTTTLRHLPELWKSVSHHPTFFLALAVKLKDAELFWDAVRHVCGRGCFDCLGFDEQIEAIEAAVQEQYPDWDLRVSLTKYAAYMAHTAEGIKFSVLQELMSCRWVPGLGSVDALFLGSSEARGRGAAAKWLVRSIYSEWVTNQYLGLECSRPGQSMCANCCAKYSKSIYDKLLQAQKDVDNGQYRVQLFGEEAESRLAQIFSMQPLAARDIGPTGKKSSKAADDKEKQNQDLQPRRQYMLIASEFRAVLKTIVEKIKPRMEDNNARYSDVRYFTILQTADDDSVPWDAHNPWSSGEEEFQEAMKMEGWMDMIYEVCDI